MSMPRLSYRTPRPGRHRIPESDDDACTVPLIPIATFTDEGAANRICVALHNKSELRLQPTVIPSAGRFQVIVSPDDAHAHVHVSEVINQVIGVLAQELAALMNGAAA